MSATPDFFRLSIRLKSNTCIAHNNKVLQIKKYGRLSRSVSCYLGFQKYKKLYDIYYVDAAWKIIKKKQGEQFYQMKKISLHAGASCNYFSTSMGKNDEFIMYN